MPQTRRKKPVVKTHFTCAILHLDAGVLQLMPGYSCRDPSRLPSEGFSRRKCRRTSSLLKARPPLTPLQRPQDPRHSWERGVPLLQRKRRSFSSILSEKNSNHERELWTHFTPYCQNDRDILQKDFLKFCRANYFTANCVYKKHYIAQYSNLDLRFKR